MTLRASLTRKVIIHVHQKCHATDTRGKSSYFLEGINGNDTENEEYISVFLEYEGETDLKVNYSVRVISSADTDVEA